ncbi:hypothetical protein HNR46_003265 [Haloferula luteola]|uniref:YXWGXW repeat-containing protein n=1 Tax=Haloferula luteola TaxID=595692 RepID=A0A840V4W1_9BACT|nr:YXWGXW repeat-containing protein [Haloferula luteola]MBB5353012.1 hypothetical protein [Haloferula luteola]
MKTKPNLNSMRLLVLVVVASFGWAAAQEDVEVLTRGPMHEAFAEAVSFEPEPGLVVASSPPEWIDELPPDQRPEGDNVAWIPGYWGWDDEQNDYLWISGVWRDVPPGRQWVPGYWNSVDSGYQWISGYWGDVETEEVTYVSTAPPTTLEVGPNVAAPSQSHVWVPGNWRWSESRYAWRPGYWIEPRSGWTWVPARYVWTPRGFVYVNGYWDYGITRRGVLFAPVSFRHSVWNRPGYHYTPQVVIDLGVVSAHLFVRPRLHHYYFGDYYAPRYRDAGYYANFQWHQRHGGYDPIFAYQSWQHRGDRHWARMRAQEYDFYRKNDRYRPPHTWSVMKGLTQMCLEKPYDRQRLFASTFEAATRSSSGPARFRPLESDRKSRIVSERAQFQQFTSMRREMERSKPSAAGKVSHDGRMKASPVASRQRMGQGGLPARPRPAAPNASRAQNRPPAAMPKQNRPGERKAQDRKAAPQQPQQQRKAAPQRPQQQRKAAPQQPQQRKAAPQQPQQRKAAPQQPQQRKAAPQQPQQRKAAPQRPQQQRKAAPQQPQQQRKAAPQQPQQQRKVAPQRPQQQRKASPQRPQQQRKAAPQRPQQQRKASPQQPQQQRKVAPQRPQQQRKAAPQRPQQQRKAAPQRPQQQRKMVPQQPRKDRGKDR